MLMLMFCESCGTRIEDANSHMLKFYSKDGFNEYALASEDDDFILCEACYERILDGWKTQRDAILDQLRERI